MSVSSCFCSTTPKLFARTTQSFNLYTCPSKTHFRFSPICRHSSLALKPQPRCGNNRRSHITCMFTGIVEEMGEVKNLGTVENDGVSMKIGARTVLEGVNLGDSIAVNGTCLTVTEFDTQSCEFSVGLSPETLRKTSLEAGSPVNLERAVQPRSRMGGHFVQGHVDGTGEIVSMDREGDSLWVKVKAEKGLLKYVVAKGFITVDGASLTVVDVLDDEDCFNFMLVAYTQQKVVIPLKKVGEQVNLEVDILGKYVERLLNHQALIITTRSFIKQERDTGLWAY